MLNRSSKKITLDRIPFQFGKYIGLTAEEIVKKDIDYIIFAYYTYHDAPISENMVRICQKIKWEIYDD